MSKAERERRKDLIDRRQFPNNCFCEPFGERVYDGPILRYVLVDQFLTNRKVLYPVRSCGKCGKEYLDAPPMA